MGTCCRTKGQSTPGKAPQVPRLSVMAAGSTCALAVGRSCSFIGTCASSTKPSFFILVSLRSVLPFAHGMHGAACAPL